MFAVGFKALIFETIGSSAVFTTKIRCLTTLAYVYKQMAVLLWVSYILFVQLAVYISQCNQTVDQVAKVYPQ